MGEMPLEMRREQLSLNYWVSLQGHSQDHPTKDTLKPCWEKERKETKSFGWTVIQKATELEVDEFKCSPTVPLPAIPPWILPDATVDNSLLKKKDKDIENIIHSQTVQPYINNYHGYVQLYTDASKIVNKRGLALIVPEFQYKVGKRISDNLSVYTGEMLAIL